MLTLLRTYFPTATHGKVLIDNELIVHTIELPWKNNEKRISCIPEGTYPIRKRFSQKFNWHYILENVPNRSLILIHPANNAQKELMGCIAPVNRIVKEGIGEQSRKAMQHLMNVLENLEKKDKMQLTIKKDENE